MTFQACSISEARYLYDQLAVVTPIVVSTHIENTIGAFHSTKNSGLNFRKFPVANGTFFRNSGKEESLARYTQILENFLSGISVSFDFPPGISGIFGSMVATWKFNHFRIFRKLPQEISIPLRHFLKFQNFRLSGKCPIFPAFLRWC